VTDWERDLALAHALADAADAVTTERFLAADLVIDTKPDLTPVTDADRAVERALRDILTVERRDDSILGEEYGASGSGPRRWVIDPIDGTKNYVRGVPVWATLIGLQDDEKTVVGMVSAPALGRRWWASAGGGAWTATAGNPRPCRVSKVRDLNDASLSYSSLTGWQKRGRQTEFLGLLEQVWRSRAYGDFWSHMMVAEGAVDISCEPELSLWDVAALQVIITEAGGRFSNLSGLADTDGGSLVCSNGLLHDDLLAILGDSTTP
jgi:histidinol-phosphatase